MGLSRTVFELKGDNCKILSPPCIWRRRWGVPLEFCNVDGLRKLEWCPYQTVKKCDNVSIRLDTVPALDRRMDLPSQ